jgi:hypothetical protein
MVKNNIYSGIYDPDANEWYKTYLNGETFDTAPSLQVINSSPDGFSWGYYGSGPHQLATGILLNEFDEEIARKYNHEFCIRVIAPLPNKEVSHWELTSVEVKNHYDAIRRI